MVKHLHKARLFLIVIFFVAEGTAQDIPLKDLKYIWFPHPMEKNWQSSIGFLSTTLPRDIAEEIHFRVPAGQFHAIKKIGDKMYLDGRVNIQVLQNLISAGPRWATKLNDRISMSLGNDVAYWFGIINLESIKTKGHGIQNYPSISFGYRFNKAILLSAKAESIMNLVIKTYAGDREVATDYRLFSGSSYTIALEQPFFGKKSLTLGFRGIYTNFYWQTWTLFESFDRNIFFPQLIVGLIL